MTIKTFLTSVADVDAYDENQNIVFTSKTLLDSSVDVKLGSTPIRGGKGSQLLFVYYHTNEMTIQLSDTQFNLAMLGSTQGSDVTTGNDIYTSETITLTSGGGGTVSGTPLAISGTTVYGWVKQLDGSTERVTFTGSTFSSSSGTSGDVVCVTYYVENAASTSITIPANAIPKVLRLVMRAQLNSGDESANVIGEVQFIVPKATLSGAFNIAMKSDGVSTTPLSAMALASEDLTTAACSNVPVNIYAGTYSNIWVNLN